MRKTIIATIFLVCAAQQAKADSMPTLPECVEMGIEYYKDIGSFPTLSTGEDALEKVISMCERSLFAFGQKQ